MARSDLLVSLIRAGATGDQETLKSTTEALMADERAVAVSGLRQLRGVVCWECWGRMMLRRFIWRERSGWWGI